jgi:23S rRNA (cytosine1962-C5)-methyltransferase
LIFEALELLVKQEHAQDKSRPDWENTAIVLANDSKSRVQEGLNAEEKRLVREIPNFVPSACELLIQSGSPDLPNLNYSADLIGGQKTGFFLDQRLNVQLASRLVREMVHSSSHGKKELRVLDLCCYIGQWGGQLSHLVSQVSKGAMRAHVTCVDASAQALALATKNVEANGGVADPRKSDVLAGGLDAFDPRSFDVVICDPPAFIKKKKDIPAGSQAYYKMNREALKKTVKNGLYISCSCSGLFTEEDFREMLARVCQSQAGEMETRWLARGGHSPDHPQRPEFPQGTYLKSWMGVAL